MPEAAAFLSHSITSAGISMRAALAGLGPEDMVREPGSEWRSVESLLGKATMALRDSLVAIGHADLPDVPEGFLASSGTLGDGGRFGRSHRRTGPRSSRNTLEALVGAVQSLGPHHLSEPVDSPGAFDERGLFFFRRLETCSSPFPPTSTSWPAGRFGDPPGVGQARRA